jgi:hypothetical protein
MLVLSLGLVKAGPRNLRPLRRHCRRNGDGVRPGTHRLVGWSDENFGRETVQWCLDNFDDYRHDYSDEELAAVKASLVDLLALDDAIRDPEPDDYDDEHPENYPPAVEMVRK